MVAVLLAEESYSAQFLGFVYGHVAMVLQGDILADAAVDDTLDLTQLFGSDFLEVAEIETESFG